VPSKQFNKKSTAARNFIQQRRRRTSALSAKRHKVKLTPLMFSPLQQLFSLFSPERQLFGLESLVIVPKNAH
jgi:hypothetical protein